MLNKLLSMLRQYRMVETGERVICAVSGGADSISLLFAMYLLREKLGITVEAAHFNHCLRGRESDEDEAFVRRFCAQFDIALHVGRGNVKAGEKGLEAAAREARYAFFASLGGKIATAHTADDNAETVLLHLVRGTGLKGLGAIAPVRGNIIRPLLLATRKEVCAFAEEYGLSYREDSSNASDAFLRNRLRHHVMPLLRGENPDFSRSVSEMALRLREDEDYLEGCADSTDCCLDVNELIQMHPALRSRVLFRFLKKCGVQEPEAQHVQLTQQLLFTQKPSARIYLPGGVTVTREYGKLKALEKTACLQEQVIACPSECIISDLGLKVTCRPASEPCLKTDCFTVSPRGTIVIRSRRERDTMRLHGGTKSLKKLFIDKKIPASKRQSVPVIADDSGVLGVYGFGANLDRVGDSVVICFEQL